MISPAAVAADRTNTKPTDVNVTLGGGLTPEGMSHDSVTLPLAKAPHILVAGMTGGGKSVVVHDIITQLLGHPSRWVNLVLIDPKRVEFGQYEGIPHLGWPHIAYTAEDAERALAHISITEMGVRFHHMQKAGVRDFSEMNPPWARTVVFIDELANLVLRSRKLERYIVDIASMGRAAGIHLVLATQRPSADVITGLIRANVPTRICLPVITKTESRIVLDVDGAERLESPGDILIRLPGTRDLFRTRGRFISDQDIDQAIRRARR